MQILITSVDEEKVENKDQNFCTVNIIPLVTRQIMGFILVKYVNISTLELNKN